MAKKTFTKKRRAGVCARRWHGESEKYVTERDQREGWISEREGE